MTSAPLDDATATKRPYPRCGSARCLAAVAFGAISLLAIPASAHVAFEGIDSGARFLAGSVVELTWIDTIAHQTTAYHVELLPGGEAAAVPIASDIPPTQHTFSWQVPAEACGDCSLHIIQDNVASDYSATLPITIVVDPNELTTDEGTEDPREGSGTHLPPDMAGTAGAPGAASAASAAGVPGAAGAQSQPAGCSFRAVPRSISTRDALLFGWLLAAGVFSIRRRKAAVS